MQEKLINKQFKEFAEFGNEQDAINAVPPRAAPGLMQEIRAGLKKLSTVPLNELAKISLHVENLKHAMPFILFENLPKPVQNKTASKFVQMIDKRMASQVEQALAELSSVPEGKMLVDQARKDGISIMGTPGPLNGNEGVLLTFIKRDEDGQRRLLHEIKVNTFHSRGKMASLLAHELQHYNQAKNKMLGVSVDHIEAPLDSVWRNRMTEADAQATAVDIIYKLKLAGKPEAWNEELKRKNGYSPIAREYEKLARSDPSSVEDGRAKRAAFDKWFAFKTPVGNADISRFYNRQGILNFPDKTEIVLRAEKDGAKISPLTPQELERLGTLLPAKTNYLDNDRDKPLDSRFYRARNFSGMELDMLKNRYDVYGTLKGVTPQQQNPAASASLPQKPDSAAAGPAACAKPAAKAPGMG
jgi:hypothetical protein